MSKKQWTLWARKTWTDLEPDTFYVSVESATPESTRHIVVSGCATWLTVEQAREVFDFWAQCILLCERGPKQPTPEEGENLDIREMIVSEREQVKLLGPDGIRVGA